MRCWICWFIPDNFIQVYDNSTQIVAFSLREGRFSRGCISLLVQGFPFRPAIGNFHCLWIALLPATVINKASLLTRMQVSIINVEQIALVNTKMHIINCCPIKYRLTELGWTKHHWKLSTLHDIFIADVIFSHVHYRVTTVFRIGWRHLCEVCKMSYLF